MKVLIIGSGGREHALAWRLSTSRSVSSVVVVPGNEGISREENCSVRNEEIIPALLHDISPDLVVVGAAKPLVEGLADRVRAEGFTCVGPPGEAAIIGGSKTVAKETMLRFGVPTPAYRSCTDPDEAIDALEEFDLPVAVKADGLAAGTGVTLCTTREAAEIAIDGALRQRRFGAAGERVVIEEYRHGPGATLNVLVDESGHIVLPPARDYERAGEGGTGPNTRGMGAVVPNELVTPDILQQIRSRIVEPSIKAVHSLIAPGSPGYRGVLHLGLILAAGGPVLLDYKVRFGDPELQALLPLIEGDLGVLLHGLGQGRVVEAAREAGFSIALGAACSVVAISVGYPRPVSTGMAILDRGSTGTSGDRPDGDALEAADRAARVYYDAVTGDESGPVLRTAGGRVLTVSAVGASLPEARFRVYERLLQIEFQGMVFRRDIGGESVIPEVIEEANSFLPQFEKRGGLLPVVVQDSLSGDVLMVAYANAEALDRTIQTGLATFWSTSRDCLWTKGETSGDTLAIEEIRVDCDQDALVYRVRLVGAGVCHTSDSRGTHRRRCFYRVIGADHRLFHDP